MASSEPVQPLYPALDPQRHGSNLAAAVVAAIEEEIVRRGWPVGTVIATEAELLERFDVSSPVMRQAVSILESNQIARMRRGPGGGLVVIAPDETSVGNSVALYLEYLRVRPELVSEARAAVEIACVELAAARIGEADVAPLRALVDAESERALRGDYDSLADIHLAIGELSGNPVLSLFQKMLTSLLISRSTAERDRWRTRDLTDLIEQDHRDHLAIVEALAAGDGAMARLRMVRHLEHSRYDSAWWQPPGDPDERPRPS
jgi:DNA-binding FadR family transcriptional regulator